MNTAGGASKGVGCGASINWSTMNTAPIPPEFYMKVEANVNDVEVMPESAQATWEAAFNETTKASTIGIKKC